jgi:hypothetical protein
MSPEPEQFDIVARPDGVDVDIAPWCDWGDCDNEALRWLVYDAGRWLPVCDVCLPLVPLVHPQPKEG